MASDGQYPRQGPDVFFAVSIGGRPVGKLVFRLYYETTPKTAYNFHCLCTGERGVGATTGKPLHYLHSFFHRVIPGFMAQGGDFSNKNGTGGESVFGGKFRDENFIKRHIKPGLLSMANAGPNSNGSQFFITFRATPHLDGKHVVFGELIQGADVLRRIEAVSTGERDKPVFGEEVRVDDCGEMKPRAPSAPAATSASAGDVSRSSGDRHRSSSKKHKRDRSSDRSSGDSDDDHRRKKHKKHKSEKKSKKERHRDRSRSRSRSPKRSRDPK